MSQVQEIDVDNVRQRVEVAKKVAKEAEKVNKKLTVKASKRPMNSGAVVSDPSPPPEDHEISEYKLAVPMLLVEGASKLIPRYINANGDRLRQRLLRSPDLGVLAERAFSTISIENPKLQFLGTMTYHILNEWLQASTAPTAVTPPAPAPLDLTEQPSQPMT